MEKTFTVTGMKCPNCEAHVENALKAIDGVSSVKADRNACNVSVVYNDSKVTMEKMQEAVNSLGRYELQL